MDILSICEDFEVIGIPALGLAKGKKYVLKWECFPEGEFPVSHIHVNL
jgi:hypothetical protein